MAPPDGSTSATSSSSSAWAEHKEAGTKAFKNDNMSEAIKWYTKGIEVLINQGPPDLDDLANATLANSDEQPYHVSLGQLYNNRGLCWFREDKFVETVEDCNACLKLIHDYPKALYRRACAHQALRNYSIALQDAMIFSKSESGVPAAQRLGPKLVEVIKKTIEEERVVRQGSILGKDFRF